MDTAPREGERSTRGIVTSFGGTMRQWLSPSDRLTYEARVAAAVWVNRDDPTYARKGIHAAGLRGGWPDTVVFAEWAGPLGDGEWSTGIYSDRPFEQGSVRDRDPEAFAIDFLDAVMEL
jgi:hypothetical protein